MSTHRTVVVPVDGSAQAETVLHAAAPIAQRLGADLLEISASAVVDAVVGNDAALVCVAAGTRSHLARPVLGRTAAALLAELDGPVMLIGPRCHRMAWDDGADLLVCVDGSGLSEAVLPVATAWSRSLALTPCLLHVLTGRPVAACATPRLPHGDVLESNYVAGLAKGLRRGGARVEWDVVHGRMPARAIVSHAASRSAALIALSSHSRPDTRGPLGRVALDVVAASSVPVLVARSQGLWRAVMALAEPLPQTATGL